MAKPTLKYAANATLNCWLIADRRLHLAVNSGSREEKLKAISEAASRNKVARELNKKYDVGNGLSRYEPVLDAIDGLTPADFSNNPIETVLMVRDKLFSRYGNQDVDSATTTLLWVKVRAHIIIYNQHAQIALGTPNLREFYEHWTARFSYHEKSIIEAARSLHNILEFVYDPDVATSDYVSELAESKWFHYRIFDNHLRNIGHNAE